MSDINFCAIKLIRLLFGEVVERVVSCLAKKGGALLRDIVSRSNLSKSEVSHCYDTLLSLQRWMQYLQFHTKIIWTTSNIYR